MACRHQASNWANVDPYFRRHIASLCRNALHSRCAYCNVSRIYKNIACWILKNIAQLYVSIKWYFYICPSYSFPCASSCPHLAKPYMHNRWIGSAAKHAILELIPYSFHAKNGSGKRLLWAIVCNTYVNQTQAACFKINLLFRFRYSYLNQEDH